MPASMPLLKELYLADIQHDKTNDEPKRMFVPESFTKIGFPELEILDISSAENHRIDHTTRRMLLPSLSFFIWFKSCNKLRELYVEDYLPDYYTDVDDDVYRATGTRHFLFFDALQNLKKLEVLSLLRSRDIHFPDDFQFPPNLKQLKHDDADEDVLAKLRHIKSFKELYYYDYQESNENRDVNFFNNNDSITLIDTYEEEELWHHSLKPSEVHDIIVRLHSSSP
jgi:hypothetical protein